MNPVRLATPSLPDDGIVFGDKKLHRIIDLWKLPKSRYPFREHWRFFTERCTPKIQCYAAPSKTSNGIRRPTIHLQQPGILRADRDKAICVSPSTFRTVPCPNTEAGSQQNNHKNEIKHKRWKARQSVQQRTYSHLLPPQGATFLSTVLVIIALAPR